MSKTNSQPEVEPALLTIKFHAICLATQKTKISFFGVSLFNWTSSLTWTTNLISEDFPRILEIWFYLSNFFFSVTMKTCKVRTYFKEVILEVGGM